MYALIATDALLRIVVAMAALFLGVPSLARRRPESLDRFEWFWWCLAAGITALTLFGQLLTLANLFSPVTLLAGIVAVIIVTRARLGGRPVGALLRDAGDRIVVSSVNVLEGRVNLRRRVRRAWRVRSRKLRAWFAPRTTRLRVGGWSTLVAVSAALRLIRPYSTANLGFSDTYAHLYLLRLLEQGRQVDPAWGPYPRGMHFLLMAIHDLTNVDAILLLNLFGAVVGVLITLSVADAARRLAGSLKAGLVAGLLFATMTGGAAQYFVLGGSIATADAGEGHAFVRLAADQIGPTSAEYDVLATVFQRQTATLPQELAMVLLFPAALFLLRFCRTQGSDGPARWWTLTGYLSCAAAIAAVHPGVAVPLVILSAITVITTRANPRDVVRAALTGAAGIALGSTWLVAFIRYGRAAARGTVASGSDAGTTAMYYFPFLRHGDDARIVTWVAITPVVVACLIVAVAMLVHAVRTPERRTHLAWISGVTLALLVIHVSSRYHLPELVEIRRNASWLAMALSVLLGVAAAELSRARLQRFADAAIAVLLLAWLVRVPVAAANDRLIDYSGYSATAYTVLELERDYEPFTWTLVTYGQEFPMVLGKGFHLAAADFLDRFDPDDPRLRIPTKYVFIVVEKQPHRFEINSWAARFSRTDLERRLQTWCFLYQLKHRDIRVHHDDDQVRVYRIERSDAEVRQIAGGAR